MTLTIPMKLSLLFLSAQLLSAAAPFSFAVDRTKLTRDERGELTIAEAGVSYRSENGKTTFQIPFSEIREADVSDPKRISLETFDVTKKRLGGHTTFSFRLRDGRQTEELARFLSTHIKRPVVGTYSLRKENVFEIPAYHRELMGGAHGTVIIGTEGIRFLSDKAKQSRTWLYQDIETIGMSNPFSFRVSTYAETFTFELKARLPDEAYRLAFEKVHRLEGAPTSPVERQ